MHMTPNDIAASIGNDPSIKAGDILHKYLFDEAIIRFDGLHEHFLNYGLNLTEQEMIRLMTVQEDILFTEGLDDKGRFWQSSIAPDIQPVLAEGYLDHRITDQYDDAMGQDFNDEEEDFTGRDLEGINAAPEPGNMNNLNSEDGMSGGPGAFDAQTEPPDATAIATDQEIPPAMVPRAMPDMVAQAMAQQMPPGMDPNMPEPGMDPDMPEPGMIPGPTDQVDMDMAPAQGPGEEQPAPQTGAPLIMQPQVAQPQVAQPGIAQPQMVQPQVVPVAQGMVPQQVVAQEPETDFGDDGADYTIDPFLNALKQATNVEEETDILQSPQTSNTPSTGAKTQQDRHYTAPHRYSKRMREAFEKRQRTLND